MSNLHVIFSIDNMNCAIPADDVLQMDSFEGTTPVPGSPAYVRGLTQVRQQIVPVIDTRLRFGLPARLPDFNSRLIVLKLGKRLVGILVDSAREVQNIAPEAFQATPGLMEQNGGSFIKAVANISGKLIMLIDSLKIAGKDSNHG